MHTFHHILFKQKLFLQGDFGTAVKQSGSWHAILYRHGNVVVGVKLDHGITEGAAGARTHLLPP